MGLKNKKGFLLANETLKIIIAVICIGFLAYFLAMLYVSKTESQKKLDAENSLDRMKDIMDGLDVGGSEIQGIGSPRGWHLFGFVSGDKPNSCVGENCFCICGKAVDIGDTFDRQIKKCDDSGVCLQERDVRGYDLDLKIMGGNSLVFVEISKTSRGIFVKEVK